METLDLPRYAVAPRPRSWWQRLNDDPCLWQVIDLEDATVAPEPFADLDLAIAECRARNAGAGLAPEERARLRAVRHRVRQMDDLAARVREWDAWQLRDELAFAERNDRHASGNDRFWRERIALYRGELLRRGEFPCLHPPTP